MKRKKKKKQSDRLQIRNRYQIGHRKKKLQKRTIYINGGHTHWRKMYFFGCHFEAAMPDEAHPSMTRLRWPLFAFPLLLWLARFGGGGCWPRYQYELGGRPKNKHKRIAARS